MYRFDRIAQLILVKIETPNVQENQELKKTERSVGDFGSTITKYTCWFNVYSKNKIRIYFIVFEKYKNQRYKKK